MTIKTDFACEWGGDFQLNAYGTLVVVSGVHRIAQRIVRRILTNSNLKLPDGTTLTPGYIYDVTFGENGGAMVDQNPTKEYITVFKKLVIAGVIADTEVDASVMPTVVVNSLGNLFQVIITFTPIGQSPVALTLNM